MVWGGLLGFYLMLERFLKSHITLKINAWNGIVLAFLTYTCVNITWVFFRAEEFGTAMDILGSMFFMQTGEKVVSSLDLWITFLVIGLLFIVHWLMRNTSVKAVSEKTPWWVLSIVWAVMLFLLLIAQTPGEQFIYFQF